MNTVTQALVRVRFVRDPDLRRVGIRGLVVAAWTSMLIVNLFAVYHYIDLGIVGWDTHAYWLAGNVDAPYSAAPNTHDAFLYSPAFLQVTWPLAQLPWPVFYLVWVTLEGLAFAWLVRPLPFRWAAPMWLAAVPEMLMGNVVGFLCVMLVLGVTRSWPWSFGLLTKVTPGGLGVVYLAGARQWRKALMAVGIALAIAAVSFLLSPDLWRQWVTFMLHTDGGKGSAAIRAGLAVVAVFLAGRFRQPWLLAPAALLSTPVIGWHTEHVAMLLALPRLVLHQMRGNA